MQRGDCQQNSLIWIPISESDYSIQIIKILITCRQQFPMDHLNWALLLLTRQRVVLPDNQWWMAIVVWPDLKQLFLLSYSFLAHIRWKLKLAFLFKMCPLSVVVVVIVVINFSLLQLLLQKHWTYFKQKKHEPIFRWRAFKFVTIEDQSFFQREMIKNYWKLFGIFQKSSSQ